MVCKGVFAVQDWASNLRLKFSSDTSSSYFQELYAGSEVYEGELDMFRAVTDQASVSTATAIRSVSLLTKSSTCPLARLHWGLPN